MQLSDQDWDDQFLALSQSSLNPSSDSKATGSLIAGCSDVVVDVDVDVDVDNRQLVNRGPKPTSRVFESLVEDAPGVRPIPIDVGGLPAPQQAVLSDCAFVAAVVEHYEGEGAPFPYSQRWRSEVLGYSSETIRKVLILLVQKRYLVKVGKTERRPGHPPINLYRIGARARRISPVEAPAVETDFEP